MLSQKLFRVPGLAVSNISIARFGIDDMLFHHGKLRHALFRRLDLGGQFVKTIRSCFSLLREITVVEKPVFL